MTKFRTSVLAVALLTGVTALGLTSTLAEAAAAPGDTTAAGASHHQGRAWLTPGQLVEGRIAFLKTELKITPAQEAQWQQYASVMRQNAQALDQAIADAHQHRGTAMNAVERMEMRAQFAKVRAENEARLLAAFRPLYGGLSAEQQQVANALVAPHDGWRHGWRHRA